MSVFFKASRPPLEPIQSPIQCIRRFFLRGYSGRDMKLTYLHIVPQLRMSGATSISLFPPHSLTACTGATLPLQNISTFQLAGKSQNQSHFSYNPPSWDDLISNPCNNLRYLWCADIAKGPAVRLTATTHYLYYASNKIHKQT